MTKTSSKKVVDYGLLIADNVLSETQYYQVVKKSGDKVQLVNDSGENIIVDKNYVENCLTSANQFTEEKTVTKTEAANIFLSNPNVAMTVNFNKQVKDTEVVKEIMEAYEGSSVKTMESAIKKAVKRALEGEERTMIGRHSSSQDEYGRVHFVDMSVTKDVSKSYDVRQRLVDTRTLNWLVVNGIKYTVK